MDAHARAAHAAVVAPPTAPGCTAALQGSFASAGAHPRHRSRFALLSALKVDQQNISEETYGV